MSYATLHRCVIRLSSLAAGVIGALSTATFCSSGIAAEPHQVAAASAELAKVANGGAASCQSLRSFHLEGGRITSSSWIRNSNDLDVTPKTQLPAEVVPFCRVTAVLAPNAAAVGGACDHMYSDLGGAADGTSEAASPSM